MGTGERSRMISKLNFIICIKHNTLISSFFVMKRSFVSSSVENEAAAYLCSELLSRLLKLHKKCSRGMFIADNSQTLSVGAI